MLPDWPEMTVAVLATAGPAAPHAIPVSAVVRAGPRRALVALARTRTSLAYLRARPRVTLCVTATDTAFSADGVARVVEEELLDGMAAVAIEVEAVHDHLRPTFAIRAGVRWEWTDPAAAARDAETRAALSRLATGSS